MDAIHLSVLKSWIERREEGRGEERYERTELARWGYTLWRERNMQKIEELFLSLTRQRMTFSSISGLDANVARRPKDRQLLLSHCFLPSLPGCNAIPLPAQKPLPHHNFAVAASSSYCGPSPLRCIHSSCLPPSSLPSADISVPPHIFVDDC